MRQVCITDDHDVVNAAANRVDLGELKGNIGSQNYPHPPDVELSRYRSVTIWCARFHVSFGAAELTA